MDPVLNEVVGRMGGFRPRSIPRSIVLVFQAPPPPWRGDVVYAKHRFVNAR